MAPQSPLNNEYTFFFENQNKYFANRVPSPVTEESEKDEQIIQSLECLEPTVVVKPVLNRKGRPKNSSKQFGFFGLDKRPKRKLEFESTPIAKKTRSQTKHN